jgi:hypothetical protein
MKLSVVIVNYNTRDDLRACLNALQQIPLELEIIVVDNASGDGSAEMVRREFPRVNLLVQNTNTWFCGGNNIGIAAATGDYVLLLNPDTVPAPDALPLMLAYLEAHPDYTGVTAQLRYPDGTVQRTCSRIPTYTYLLLNHTPLGWVFPGWRARVNAHHWYADWGRDTDFDVEVMPGSCTMMKKPFTLDGDLWLYFPEDDLARRLKAPKNRFLAAAQITHKEKSVTRTWRATQIYFRDMFIYTRKHHGAWRAGLLWFLSRPLVWGMAIRQQWKS